jgi:hypothetical protein
LAQKLFTLIKKQKPSSDSFKIITYIEKKYPQRLEQIIIFGDSKKTYQVIGYFDSKTNVFEKITDEEITINKDSNESVSPVYQHSVISSTTYNDMATKTPFIKTAESELINFNKIFRGKQPSYAIVEKYQVVYKINFVHDISNKRFLSVVVHDPTKNSYKVIEVSSFVNPENPVVVEHSVVQGKTTITTNNVQEMTTQNSNTVKVINQIRQQYPQLTESQISTIKFVNNTNVEEFHITLNEKNSTVKN